MDGNKLSQFFRLSVSMENICVLCVPLLFFLFFLRICMQCFTYIGLVKLNEELLMVELVDLIVKMIENSKWSTE